MSVIPRTYATIEPAAEPRAEKPRVTRQKMTPLRKRITEQLVNAQHTAAILTTFNEVDMSAVMGLRGRYKTRFSEVHGVALGDESLLQVDLPPEPVGVAFDAEHLRYGFTLRNLTALEALYQVYMQVRHRLPGGGDSHLRIAESLLDLELGLVVGLHPEMGLERDLGVRDHVVGAVAATAGIPAVLCRLSAAGGHGRGQPLAAVTPTSTSWRGCIRARCRRCSATRGRE